MTNPNLNENLQSIEYTGVLNDYQLSGNDYEGEKFGLTIYDHLNSHQNFLYSRVLSGLNIYEPQEIKAMHWKKRKKILKTQKKAKNILNLWRQRIINMMTTKFFQDVFPKAEITKYITETDDYVDALHETDDLDFKLFGITEKNIIDLLITESLLPKNFYQLKTL
jgi:hypothetical protein